MVVKIKKRKKGPWPGERQAESSGACSSAVGGWNELSGDYIDLGKTAYSKICCDAAK
jgi:hypothetical protein